MKILIAGFGSIGRRHFHNLLALGYKDIVFYRSQKSTPDEEEALKDFPVETDLKAALAHNPDVVIVSNPTALHLDIAIPAAQAGCHILLEKPISHNMERVEEFREAVEKSGSRVFVGFQFRFHPGLRQVRRLLSQEAIGRPLSVRAHWGEYLPDWHPLEDYREGYSARADLGGGVLLTLSHPLDYLRWLLGEVQAVWGILGENSDLELDGVEDTAEIGLRFASGVLGSVHLNYTQRPPSHRLEIVGTKGTLRWDYDPGTVELYDTEKEEWEKFPTPTDFERNDLFLSEMKHFVAVALGQFTPICSLDDGMKVQEIIESIKQSAKSGLICQIS